MSRTRLLLAGIIWTACDSPSDTKAAQNDDSRALCAKLEADGAAKDCRAPKQPDEPVYSKAKSVSEFSVPGGDERPGVVLVYDSADAFDSALKSWELMTQTMGVPLFKNEKKRVLATIPSGSSKQIEAIARSAVEAW